MIPLVIALVGWAHAQEEPEIDGEWRVIASQLSDFPVDDDGNRNGEQRWLDHRLRTSVSGRVLPDDFPQIGGGFGIDGGKTVEAHAPIRGGETLSAVTTIADLYDKTGRSGTMVFIVQRMTFHNQAGEKVSTVDWKMIRRA